MTNRIFWTVAIMALSVVSSHAVAEDMTPAQKLKAFPMLVSSPLRPGQSEEKYLDSVKVRFDAIFGKRESYSTADYDAALADAVRRAGVAELRNLVGMDENQDARLTREDMQKAASRFSAARGSQYADREKMTEHQYESQFEMLLKDKDADGDGELSYQEMAIPSERAKSRAENSMKQIRSLLDIDPNKDGTLTRDELMGLAKSVFAIADADSDKTISEDEFNAIFGLEQARRDRGMTVNDRFPKCRISGLPKEFHLYGAGGRGRPVGNFIDHKSGQEAQVLDVVVNKTDMPVALALSSYGPTIWRIKTTPGSVVAAVLVSGYHKQVVQGAAPNVPVRNSSYDEPGDCDYFHWQSENSDRPGAVISLAFGKKAELLYMSKDTAGIVVVGDASYDPARLETVGTDTLESAFISQDALPGPAGLQQAVEKGILRKATDKDLSDWTRLVAEKGTDDPRYAGLPPIAGEEGVQHKLYQNVAKGPAGTYVILKEFTFPVGLFGALSASFILMEGVPYPEGNAGHSTVYDRNTAECKGPRCRL